MTASDSSLSSICVGRIQVICFMAAEVSDSRRSCRPSLISFMLSLPSVPFADDSVPGWIPALASILDVRHDLSG